MQLLHPESREQWLNIRKGYISSTESAALFGMSPYNTAFEIGVLKRKADDATDQDLIGTERTRWGLRLQDAIAMGIAHDHGIRVDHMGLKYAIRDDVRMGSSFDYMIAGFSGVAKDPALSEMFARLGPGLLEIKNVDSLVFKRTWPKSEDGDYEAPEHIEIQLQHQLEIMGLPWGCIAVLVGGNTARVIVRERDTKVGGIIVAKVRKFWTDFDNGILPDPLMPTDAGAVIALNQYADPGKLFNGQSDEELLQLTNSYNNWRQDMKNAETESKVVKALILQRIGTAEKALIKGGTIHAAMRAPVRVEAYDKVGYRDFRTFMKKQPETTKDG
jgi:predicted phage-related endonuclease